jgi:hypothetical protein
MNNSRNILADKLKIDREIEEMKKYPIDYSDIPERNFSILYRLTLYRKWPAAESKKCKPQVMNYRKKLLISFTFPCFPPAQPSFFNS